MSRFDFKKFSLVDDNSAMKVGTDGVLLGSWAQCSGASAILDIGCGSGLLALMLAQRNPTARIIGVEIDAAAAADARLNAQRSPWADRVEIANTDINAYDTKVLFDLIVSNPPFYATGLKAPDESRATARHEGSLSAARVIDWSATRLSDCGTVAMITPAGTTFEDELLFRAELLKLKLHRKWAVSTNAKKAPSRILWQFGRTDRPVETHNLTIRDTDNAYTPEYRSLTSDFYLNF